MSAYFYMKKFVEWFKSQGQQFENLNLDFDYKIQ